MPDSKPIAEVISIGDEMTSGARLDTNACWLSQRLEQLGVEVAFHTTVGDTLSDNIEVIQIAAERSDFIVATGGLGPTRDDLTREAMATAAGVALEFRQAAMDHILTIYSRRNREMPERNRLQAMFPSGSLMIHNPQGTAPGVDQTFCCNNSESRMFALPGVPAEMKQMFDESVAPAILGSIGQGQVIRHRVMKFFGTGESDMEHRLGQMIARERQPRVGITASAATLSLRITAKGDSEAECNSMIDQTRHEILDRVGEFYFGEGEGYEQYHAIDELLRRRGETLMVVEFGRAAPLGDWFASLGSTESYRGGLSLAKKSDLAIVTDSEIFQDATKTLNAQFDVDWVLVVDGYPDLANPPAAPLPTAEVEVLIAASDGHVHHQLLRVGGHPEILQQRIAKAAMQMFRSVLSQS